MFAVQLAQSNLKASNINKIVRFQFCFLTHHYISLFTWKILVTYSMRTSYSQVATDLFTIGTYRLTVVTCDGLEVLRTFTSKQSDVLTAQKVFFFITRVHITLTHNCMAMYIH